MMSHPATGGRATPRSILLGIALVIAISAVQGHAQTAKYPDRPVKMLVGFAAGGGTDVAARVLAQKLTESLGQSVVVENRPGASGMIAAEATAKAAADGYTLMMGSQTTLAVAPALYRKFAIDAGRDFAGVAMAGISPLVLVVHPSVPAQSVADLIALAKARPGTINFGSGGSEPPRTWPESCLRFRPASRWCTSPIAARRRQSTTCSGASCI
jgi:tripartite-type tricarboxylate transporter receptor subunit TctC